MRRREVLAGGLVLAAAGPALALDPGTASGRYEREEGAITFSRSTALILDNAEGFRDRPTTIRVLLADRELPSAALAGLAFPPVWAMARSGEIKGLLLEFDPTDRESLTVVVLDKPEPGYSLPTVSISNSSGLWKRLDVSVNRVVGELAPDASDGLAVTFNAPLFTDAVKQELKGPAAAASEPVKALIARAEALGRGDIEGAAKMSTAAAGESLRAMPAEFRKSAPRMAAEMIRGLKGAKRVLIREQTATVMVGLGEWASVVLEDGVWKPAD